MAFLTTPVAQSLMHQQHPLSIADLLHQAAEISTYCATNAAAIDHTGTFPAGEFSLMAEAGLLTAPLQAEFGGLGLGVDASLTLELLLLLKQIGRGNLAVGRVYEGHVNAIQLIQTFGTQEQIKTCASDAHNRKIFGVWNAEAEDGVKIQPLGDGQYRLMGAKTFCSGSGYVERPFVNGELADGGWQMCVVPMEDVATVSDPSWWQPPGMRATASFKVDFSDVVLDAKALIGQPGDYYRQPWLTAGVVRFAAVQLGGAEALFDATRQFLQGLDRITDPSQQARLGEMAIAIETGNLWLRGAAEFIRAYAPVFAGSSTVAHEQTERLVAYTNMVRTSIERTCMEVIQLCERSVGTRGLLPPHSMERVIRDLSLYLRQPAFDAALASAGKYALTQTMSVDLLWSDAPSGG